MVGVEVLKPYRSTLFVYKTCDIKWRGRQFIYLTKCNAHLLTRNIVENTPLRITNTSRERMLTKVEYLRSEVLTAVLLTIQVFWDVTSCHWVNKSPRFEGTDLHFEGHVAWRCFTRRLLFSETLKQTNKRKTAGPTQRHLSVRIILKWEDNIKEISTKHSAQNIISPIQLKT